MKPKNNPGDVIPLHWEGDADKLYVYGHVTPAEFRAAVAAYYDLKEGDTLSFGALPTLTEEPAHRYARYLFDGSTLDGPCRTLRTQREPSRGAFKVTAASATWEHHRRCQGDAGDQPCWIRKGHEGEHMSFDAWMTWRRGGEVTRG